MTRSGPLVRMARGARGSALVTALAVALAAGLTGAAPAGASLLVYEPFAYDAGTVLDGVPATGQNLVGPYTAIGTAPQQKITVVGPGLDYGSLEGAPTPSGNRASDVLGVTPAGASVEVDADVLVPPGSAIYFSALFTFDDSVNGNHRAGITLRDDASGDRITFGEAAVGVRAIRVEASTLATGGELEVDGADNAFTDGATLFLVGRYVNAAAAGADTLDLIGYDTARATVLPGAFDPSDPNAAFAFGIAGLDIDLTRIGSIGFAIRGVDNNFIDELRIGTTWAAVVPEPSAGALLALGLVGLARARTSRRTR